MLVALLALLSPFLPPAEEPGKPPNLLVVLLDDVGIEQLACYDDLNAYEQAGGFAYAHLPSIDALAARGLRLEQFRTMPVCSPSRASLLSGQYPSRHGVGRSVYVEYAGPHFREFGTPPAPRPPLLPELLGAAGYATAAVGKWHLALEPFEGGSLDTHPTRLGFDAFRGPPRNLFDPGSPATTDGWSPGYHNYWWIEDGERLQVTGVHASVQTAERAIDWMRGAAEPWLAYVAFNACHAPLAGDNWPAADHGFGAKPPPDEWRSTRYRATLEHMDARIGELVAAAGPDTVVFVLSDNGTNGPTFRPGDDEPRYPAGHPRFQEGDDERLMTVAPYDPVTAKGSVYEGGVRVPALVAGPGIAHGSSDALVDVVDLLPTLLALAGAERPEGLVLDGVDVSAALRDPESDGPRQHAFVEYFYPNGAGAIERAAHDRAFVRRDGEHLWKLVHLSRERGLRVERRELYHLAGPGPADPLETTDLGRKHPEFKATNQAYKALLEGF